jgi:hypothetical protein
MSVEAFFPSQAFELPPPIKNPRNPISFQWFSQHLWATHSSLLTTQKRKETCGTKDGRRGAIDPVTKYLANF